MMKRALWLLVALSLPFVFGGLHPASGAGEAFLTPTEPEFNGLPDLEADSGRFLGVSGVANQGIPESQTTGEEGDPGQLILVLVYDFDEIAGTDVKIAIFDGDTKGLWDHRDDLPPVAPEPGILKPYDTAYRVYPDPTAGVARALAIGGSETPGNVIPIGGDGDPEGSAVVPLFDRKASESPFAGTNATWVDLLDDPRDPSARVGTSNVYVYTLRVTLTAGRSGKLSGFELNGFKVATNGLMRLPRGTLLGFVGGAVDIRTVAGLAQTEDPLPGTSYFVPGTSERLTNQYQGDFTFRFRLNREVCDDLTFFEADGDWNKPIASDGLDLAPTGIPPDDGGMYQWKKQLIDNSAFAIPLGPVDQEKGLHGLLWEFRDPDGVVRKSSSDAGFGHPSFDALYQLDNFGTVFQGTTISKDVLNANLGTWALVWRGVDSRNAIWMKASGALGPSFEGPTTTGRVWCDTNRNGAFDPGEDPLVGATVLVRPVPPDGTVFPFKTDVDGIWTTTSLAAGSYEVTGVEPDPTSGVTFVPSTPLPKQFTVDACDGGRVDIPGSCLQMGKIAGRVWCDNNENARYDVPPDKPLAGVKVIIRHEGALDPVETVFTDADGKYESGELPAGKYSVSVDPDNDPKLDGVTALTPTAVLTTVIAGQTSIVDFRFRCPASVSGYVIRETRPCDGAWQKDTEVGIADVEVELTLLDEDGIPTSDVRKTTTSALGFYEFLNVTPGTYRISVDESQVNVVRLEPSSPVAVAPLVVEPVARYDDNNFFFCPGEIQVRVFRKARGDACENVVETGDTPVGGVKVLLAGTSDTTTKGPFFATTNASGVAVFTDLDADTYTVSIDGAQPSLGALEPSAPEA
ncbi:MAG: SdrD B-like domain-containing protein, partial [Planctomycetota bacterium]